MKEPEIESGVRPQHDLMCEAL